ncbi:E3 ubiquitin-protein ligase TRIM39 [Kryptolebias marmoratus]|uniref:E3 ubiquitin-protein ligase TRIM39-like n=1 Tax=Kryptolebias marmoratus TaxID=37003 RepID=A0A3Q3FZ83_KRYMA|nr:E3 ubiquitin-protein ligase TRIM39 [Kryptolebias marmoratus]
MSLPEEDLTCSVCCDIFKDPVLLPCSHSFCRDCLKQCWDTGVRGCPICRKKGPTSSPTSNLALKNVCEALQEVKRQNSEDRTNCGLHGEKLKLFCLVDRQPICVVCQSSKLHKNHECLPTEEALLDCKNELEGSRKILQEKLESLKRIHGTSAEMFTYIKNQTLKTQKTIRSQFEQLHQALYDEESARLAALEKEEEEKIAMIKERIKKYSEEALSVTEIISVIERQLLEENIVLLKNFKATQDRSKDMMPALNTTSGLLIDVSKHLSNLKYRVWEKLLDKVDYTPVTLDPNTAHPCLVLSDDLTSLHYSKQPSRCPDTPERFHMSAEVVGMTALDSGSHRWVVETGSNLDWFLGVASSSASRNAEISARPENGFWTLCFRAGELRAMTSSPTLLTVSKMPKQVKVQLDYNKGLVSFLDPADKSLIYEFTQTFKEPLFPYFYTQSSHPLRIMPEKVLITAESC